MAAAPISYGNDYAADQASIERARKYADLMQQQSMQTDQQITAGGWVVPTPKMAGVAKILQGLSAGFSNHMADKRQKDLADKQKLDLQNTLTDAQKAYMGTPAVNTTPATSNDDQGNPMPAPQTPAVAGDPMKYAQILMQNPQTQQMGMQASQQAMQQQKWAALLGNDSAGGAAPQGAPAAQGPAAPQGGESPAAGGVAPPGGPLTPDASAAQQQGAPPQTVGLIQQMSAVGITKQEMQASLMADPSGKDLMSHYAAARQAQNAPQNVREGGAVVVNGKPIYVAPKNGINMNPGPNGFTASSVPGYGAAQLATMPPQARVEMDTKAAQFHDTTGQDLPGYSQGKPMAQSAPQGSPQGMPQQNPQMAGLPPQIAAAIQNNMRNSGTQNANFRIGPTDATAGTPVAPQNIQSGQLGPGMPQQGAMPPQGQQSMPQQPTPVGAPSASIPVISPAQQREVATAEARSTGEHRGKEIADQEAQINHDASSAMQKIAQNNKMVELIPQITTGPMAKQVTNFKMLGQQLGVNLGDPSSNQEFEKYAIKGALEGAKQIYGSRLTNQDVMSQLASNPGTTMTEKALYQLIKYDNIQQQRNMDKRNSYYGEFQQTGLPKNQFGQWFDQTHPFQGLSAPQVGQSAQQTAPAQSAPAPVAGVKRYNPATGKIE